MSKVYYAVVDTLDNEIVYTRNGMAIFTSFTSAKRSIAGIRARYSYMNRVYAVARIDTTLTIIEDEKEVTV